jgi:hypothetical protein
MAWSHPANIIRASQTLPERTSIQGETHHASWIKDLIRPPNTNPQALGKPDTVDQFSGAQEKREDRQEAGSGTSGASGILRRSNVTKTGLEAQSFSRISLLPPGAAAII